MKIIFDSIEQFYKMTSNHCPSLIGLPDTPQQKCGTVDCNLCWQHCGLEYEIKSDKEESIKMIKECRNCKYAASPLMEDPCYNCIDDDDKPAFEPNQKESIEMTAEQKQPTYTDAVYELIKDECKDLDAIYEDYIISLVGNCGLGALKRVGLLEGCGVLNCRQLYTLVKINEKEGVLADEKDLCK